MSLKKKNTEDTAEKGKPPVAKYRAGLITANVWEKETDKSTFYNISFERRYKDGNGDWQTGYSFGLEDLPTVSKLADFAFTKILEAQNDDSE